ncbi:MAG: histidine triad nucleotide-binding protein, partial [Aurantimicrobium sp.]
MTDAAESIFTKIINRDIPAEILFENDRVIAIRDIAPQA